MLTDGYQRALCTSFILDHKCANGADCHYAKHGGHPAEISDRMRNVVQARRDAAKLKHQKRKEIAWQLAQRKNDEKLKQMYDREEE